MKFNNILNEKEMTKTVDSMKQISATLNMLKPGQTMKVKKGKNNQFDISVDLGA